MFDRCHPATAAGTFAHLRRVLIAGAAFTLAAGAALASSAPAHAAYYSAGNNVIDLGSERGSGTDWSREGEIITVADSDGDGVAYVVVQGVSTGGARVVVAPDTKAIVELNNAEIDLAAAGLRGAKHGIELSPGSDVEVQLREGTKSVLIGAYSNGPSGGAGIFVPNTSDLKITAPGKGTGALDATGWVAMPGIGGPKGGTSGNIQIDGGTIVAVGGDSAAGIGSGWRGGLGSITIRGGDVTATGGNGVANRNGGAGIGTGSGGASGPITITGGKVTAYGVFGAAGIGGGYQSAGVTILITGGDVTAEGTGAAAGIGSASMVGGSAKTTNMIVITGADTTIKATSGRPVGDEKTEPVGAIGFADGDGTRTEMFIMVGGPLVLNGETRPQYVNLKVSEGNTGAVTMKVPDMFNIVPDREVRIVRTINPEANFAFQTTAANQSLTFTTNGFATQPESVKTSQLEAAHTTITFVPQVTEAMLFDTGDAPAGFFESNNPLLLGYLGFAIAVALGAVVIGILSAQRRAIHNKAIHNQTA